MHCKKVFQSTKYIFYIEGFFSGHILTHFFSSRKKIKIWNKFRGKVRAKKNKENPETN